MIRVRFVGIVAVVAPLWLMPASAADLPVAPPPREIRPDGSRDPVPASGPKENPIEVVERIVTNSKAVGEKLAQTDTGTETRGVQKAILKDIDSLIDQQENPPPQGGDGNDKNKDMNKDDKPKDGMDPKGGEQPKGGMDPKGGKQPKDGNQRAGGRKPRQGERGDMPPMPPKPGQDPGGAKEEPGMAKADPKPGKGVPGGAAGNPMGTVAVRPTLPIDDAVVKEVWGHLPDKLRQQVSQYYKEQFMPKYSDLLKQYYSSLANVPKKP